MAENLNCDFITNAVSRFTVLASLKASQFAATRLTGSRLPDGLTDPHAIENAFMISVQMQDFDGELWLDGKPVPRAMLGAGTFSCYDYRRQWQADLSAPFDCLNYYLPMELVNSILEESHLSAIDGLAIAPGESRFDPVVQHLTQALISTSLTSSPALPLFIEQVAIAFCLHLATVYGDRGAQKMRSGGLTPWQKRIAADMMAANINGDVSIEDLARACGLSRAYFIRAFKQTYNMPPYRWLLHLRFERSKTLLRDAGLSLTQVAAACGFSDLAHFSRAFRSHYGVTPSAWRKSLL